MTSPTAVPLPVPPTISETVRTALEIAQEAAALVMRILPESAAVKDVRLKGPADLVTRADREAEALIVRRLREAFPGHALVGEETTGWEQGAASDAGATGGARWLVDPVDGTTNFAHGLPWFAIALGLEVAGRVQGGVVAVPPLGEYFVAERSRGAFLLTADQPPVRLAVSEVAALDDALVATGLPGEPARSWHIASIPAVMRRTQEVRIMGAAAIHMAYVAAGRLEAFWEPQLHAWDVAAGVVLVEEAGGMVTDLAGRPLQGLWGDVVATNGRIHDALLAALGA
ncbi:MAG: inositol monophosphatase family protein [Armatimonadota bacterium]|nr:inositol monophosphatase family protein [Armatimonadota bacterium]MDR7485825.1 inositol monophosphatase family protein [Armatimonadota bacterium]MDR7532122.1 inositol monophosphatase family protein [Armatimonadota bacterium]MDR7536711.1 inositol monophosphatase family protein [Armatimonadota bacterium]